MDRTRDVHRRFSNRFGAFTMRSDHRSIVLVFSDGGVRGLPFTENSREPPKILAKMHEISTPIVRESLKKITFVNLLNQVMDAM